MGMVGHAAKMHVPLADKQVQADVFLAIIKLIRDLPVTVIYEHKLTDIQELNVRIDTRAKEALMDSIPRMHLK